MRLIDADKLDYYVIHHPDDDDAYMLFITDMDIENAPTIDAVEVVRCKDCKWWDNEDGAERCTHKYCSMWAKPDGYCSYGERKESNG